MIRNIILSLVLIFGIASLNNIHAESFKATAIELLLNSPSYKSNLYSIASIQSNLKTLSNLPDPEISGEYLATSISEDNKWAAQIEWGLEWPGVYGARNAETDSKILAAKLASDVYLTNKLAEIQDLLLDYIQCRLKLLVVENLKANNDSIYILAKETARGGEMTVLDLNKVQLEYANIRAGHAALVDEMAGVIAGLSQIYGDDASPVLEKMHPEFPEIYIPSEEEMLRIKDSAPEIKVALAEADAAGKSRNVAKMEAMPSISIGYKHAFEEGSHFNGALLGISIPIFSSRGKQKAAKANILESEFKAEAASLEFEAMAFQNWKRLQALHQQINEIAPIMENADYNSSLLKAYQGGVITLIEYITDRNYFANAALELISLRLSAAKIQNQLLKYIAPLEL